MASPLEVARNTPAEIKERLTYRNEDELDTGMQKVQPLPFLDEEIHKHVKVIKESIEEAQTVNDDVPEKVYQKVDTVIREANAGKTTLFKASDLLDVTSDAFKYARQASCDRFRLRQDSQGKLNEYDEMFKSVIDNRIGMKMPEAKRSMEKCKDILQDAVEMAEEDRKSLQERMEREEADVSEDQLKDTCVSARESIEDEKGELNEIKMCCRNDIAKIDAEADRFHATIDDLESNKRREEEKLRGKLQGNRKEQERLRIRLRELEEEEQSLEQGLHIREQEKKQTVDATRGADDEIQTWKAQIEALQRRIDTALSVMKHMEECTNLIMDDAKRKKAEWKARLTEMELTNLLDCRDALMAQGVLFTVISSEAKRNSEMAEMQFAKLEKEKEEAAMTGFGYAVEELGEKSGKLSAQIKSFKKEIEKMESLLKVVNGKIRDVDGEIKRLRPSFKLGTLEDQYEERQSTMKQAFRRKGTSSVVFNSVRKYK